MTQPLENKNILLIISGSIAAEKSGELLRLIKNAGGTVRCILTRGGSEFTTREDLENLSGNHVHMDLFKDEKVMGHIDLTREADLVVIAPASANLIAKMAYGIGDDLASTTLLAANKPILLAPAMNPEMWQNAATQRNMALNGEYKYGLHVIGPNIGEVACGEFGPGRMSEPHEIFDRIVQIFAQPLKGKTALVTSGPTFEPLDPVRFIGNRSSGKQGHAIAKALADAGANVTLISGPVSLPDPAGVKTIHVETANEMLAATEAALPADIAIFAAAVADWAPAELADHKIKKRKDESPPTIALKENPDILKTISHHAKRPALVIGFAAETENLEQNAKTKLSTKGCDWVLANLVGNPDHKTFGEDQNHVYLITSTRMQDWKKQDKTQVAAKLTSVIAEYFATKGQNANAAE